MRPKFLFLLGAALAACSSAPSTNTTAPPGSGGSSGTTGTGGAETGGDNAGPEPEPEAGTGGAIIIDDAGSGGSPEASACVMPGGDCSGMADACCNGETCIYDVKAPDIGICATNCLDGTQCDSGCCAVLVQGSSAVCAPAKYCAPACIGQGQSCAGNVGGCCSGSTCVSNSLGTNCAADCMSGADCKSGCCAPTDTGQKVCSPVDYCAPKCIPLGSNCAAAPDMCCAGSSCGSDTAGAWCAKQCFRPGRSSECPTGCCAGIGFGLTYVCAAEFHCL